MVARLPQPTSHRSNLLNLDSEPWHNAWVHFAILGLVVLLGIYFGITTTEWLFVVLAAGLVLTAEAFNTAIETAIDLTSPDYHPLARDTKDVAAGAVLIAAMTAAIVGLVVFAPRIFAWLFL